MSRLPSALSVQHRFCRTGRLAVACAGPDLLPLWGHRWKGRLMKVLIASDIHGSAYWAERLVRAVEAEQPDRIVLLGDLLYHGPRNDLPREYDPKRVIPLLNGLADGGNLVAVRGNCDAEVDRWCSRSPAWPTTPSWLMTAAERSSSRTATCSERASITVSTTSRHWRRVRRSSMAIRMSRSTRLWVPGLVSGVQPGQCVYP